MQRSIALDGLFLSLLAACGGPRAADAPGDSTHRNVADATPADDATDAAIPDDGATSADVHPTSVTAVTVVRAPTVNDPDSNEPINESGGRASWLDGRGVPPSKIPALDVAAFARTRASSFVPLPASTLPAGVDYLRKATGCTQSSPVVWTTANAPPAPEIDAAIAQAADSPVLWHRGGVWYRGSVADAVLPLHGPPEAILYLALKCIRMTRLPVNGQLAFGVFKSGANVEVPVSVEEDFRSCPHSNITHTTVLLSISPDGKIVPTAKEHHSFSASDAPCVGRDTAGSPRSASRDFPRDRHEYFAALARDEAVSIDSFLRLAAELEAAGAPAELVERARRASDDEVRHAASMTSMCELFGPTPELPRRVSHPTRNVVSMLVENAREGCVNETFAALVATRQAEMAHDSSLRALFSQIAADERRHAELAWDIDDWGRSQISEDEADAIELARAEAYEALESFLEERPDRPWLPNVGEPEATLALALARGLRSALAA